MLGSNYTNTGEPFKQTAAISFYQPLTITIDAPSNIRVRANTSFSFQVSSTSALEVLLHYSTLVTSPPQLVNNLTLTSSSNRVLTIREIISLSMLSQIIQMHITVPTVTVRVTDSFGGSLVHTTASFQIIIILRKMHALSSIHIRFPRVICTHKKCILQNGRI